MNKTRNALAVTLLTIVASMTNTAHSSQLPVPGKPPSEELYSVYLEWEGSKLVSPTFLDGIPYRVAGLRYRRSANAAGKAVVGYPASDNDPVLTWYRQAQGSGEKGLPRDLSLVEYCPGGSEERGRWEIKQAVPVAYKQVKRDDEEVTFTETRMEFEHRGFRLVKLARCGGGGAPDDAPPPTPDAPSAPRLTPPGGAALPTP